MSMIRHETMPNWGKMELEISCVDYNSMREGEYMSIGA